MSPTLRTLAAALTVGAAVLTAPAAHAALPAAVATTTAPVGLVVDAGVTLNVRTGPGTSHPVVARLTGGQGLTGTVAAGWVRITSGALAGRYVSAAYVSRPPAAPPPPVAGATVTGWTLSNRQAPNIRSGPGFGYPVVGRTGIHQRLTGVVVGNWLRIGPSKYVNRGTLETRTSSVTSLNGRMSTRDLCPVPLAYNAPRAFAPGYTPSTRRFLACPALDALNDLQRAYRARFGRYAAIDLAYRPYQEQVYWFTRLGSPRAAYPGTSNHGYGIAVDFEETATPSTFMWGRPGQVWLAAHAGSYGWRNPFAYGTPHESYHFDFVG